MIGQVQFAVQKETNPIPSGTYRSAAQQLVHNIAVVAPFRWAARCSLPLMWAAHIVNQAYKDTWVSRYFHVFFCIHSSPRVHMTLAWLCSAGSKSLFHCSSNWNVITRSSFFAFVEDDASITKRTQLALQLVAVMDANAMWPLCMWL